MVVLRALPLLAHVAVVVRRRTPDAQAHRLGEQLVIAVAQLTEQSGARVEHIPPIHACEHNRRARALHLDRGAPLVAGEHLLVLLAHPLVARAAHDRHIDLVKAELEQRVHAPAGLARHIAQHKRDLAVAHERRQADERHTAGVMRRDHHRLLCELVVAQAVRLHHAVHVEFPHQHDLGAERREVEVIAQRDGRIRTVAAGESEIFHARGAEHVLELVEAGMRRAVGRDHAVHAEIAVVRVVTEVAAVQVFAPPLRCAAGVDRVVAPFPHIAAHKPGVALDRLEIVLQVARAIAHRMAEFAQHIRFDFAAGGLPVLAERAVRVRGGAGRAFGKVRVDLGDARVHAAVHVEVAVVMRIMPVGLHVPRAFVMRQAPRIVALGPRERALEPHAERAFVAHRPEQHAPVVLVALHAALHAVDDRRREVLVVGNPLVPQLRSALPVLLRHAARRMVGVVRTVRLKVGFVDH